MPRIKKFLLNSSRKSRGIQDPFFSLFLPRLEFLPTSSRNSIPFFFVKTIPLEFLEEIKNSYLHYTHRSHCDYSAVNTAITHVASPAQALSVPRFSRSKSAKGMSGGTDGSRGTEGSGGSGGERYFFEFLPNPPRNSEGIPTNL